MGTKTRTSLCHPVTLLLLIVVLGCGDGRVRLPTAPVVGSVSFKGKPLPGGRVVFFHSSGQAVAANLNANGEFQMLANQGKNDVVVQYYQSDEPGGAPIGVPPGMKPVKSLIPQHYAEPGSSGLTFEVKAGTNHKADFSLRE